MILLSQYRYQQWELYKFNNKKLAKFNHLHLLQLILILLLVLVLVLVLVFREALLTILLVLVSFLVIVGEQRRRHLSAGCR
jgi:uncharacterized membrane protein